MYTLGSCPEIVIGRQILEHVLNILRLIGMLLTQHPFSLGALFIVLEFLGPGRRFAILLSMKIAALNERLLGS